MTRFDPSIQLRRLVVTKGGSRAYDEPFHSGVNVIRSEGNSAGKSTIADLIFFALGGDLTTWKDEAASCDAVFAEVLINGARVTTRREITRSGKQPMWLYFGDFESAAAGVDEGWQRFAYARGGDRESFSEVLFRLLGMPEAPADADANITMHQLLRLIYVDQMTPPDRIFRLEPRNDSPVRREVVGDLLCGIYDARIYPAQLELRRTEKEYEAVAQRLDSLRAVLRKVDEGMASDGVLDRRSAILREQEALLLEIDNLKAKRFQSPSEGRHGPGVVEGVRGALNKVNRDLAEAQLSANQLAFAIEDAAQLIDEIRRTSAQLKQGQLASEIVGPMQFQFCPSCLSPLSESDGDHVCALCKTPIEPDQNNSRYARMRNELDMQLKESNTLQEHRKGDLRLKLEAVEKLTSLRDKLSSEYLSLTRNYLTEADARIDQLTMRLGYLNRELQDVERDARLAAELESLALRRNELNSTIFMLQQNIKEWSEARTNRRQSAYSLVSSLTRSLLAQDVLSEQEFADADVLFNFAEDRVSINGKVGFSASSLTVIRNAFHFALLWASCVDKGFLYPRFVLMDNIEDKGMTQARSQNFQRMIVRVSDELKVDHQIIFTTSMVDEQIDASNLTVGPKYGFGHKSLHLGA